MAIRLTLERLVRMAATGEIGLPLLNGAVFASNAALATLNHEEQSWRRRASEMTDEQLDALIEDEIADRIRSREDLAQLVDGVRHDS